MKNVTRACGTCQFRLTWRVREGATTNSCVIDRKEHKDTESCKHWEIVFPRMDENQRIEEGRIKRVEIASDKRSFKGMIIGGVIGVSGPVLIAIIQAFAG